MTTPVPLRRLLQRQEGADALLTAVSDALAGPVAVEDADGRIVHGPAADGAARVPVTVEDQVLGWVRGSERDARALVALVAHLASRDVEQKALGAEVLHLYREINLIYSFSEKLAALLDMDRVAQLTLQQARHLIVVTDGIVLLLDEETGDLKTIAGFGDELPAMRGFRCGEGITGAVAANGIGEVVNDVDRDSRRTVSHTAIKALICAPLKVGERTIGVIALGSTMPMQYTAAELKLVNTLGLQAATAIENARLFERTVQAALERERLLALHQAAELARAKLESELTLASQIQQNLFPSELPTVNGYELEARNRPARRCGGDYYDALPTWSADREPRLLVCVADVSGKGLPAALVMSNMQATLRALLGRIPGLPQLAGHASELLFAATSSEKYVTAALAEVVPDTGALRFVGAGHLDNAIVRGNGEISLLSSTGAPLGLMSPGLPFTETRDVLNPGDTLVLYSDGLTDAQDADGEEFGETRLHDLLRSLAGQSASTFVSKVLEAVEAFVDRTPQFDDMTILVLRRL